MTWQVTIRNKDGKRSVEFYEAVDRKQLFDILRENEVTPIRIDQVVKRQAKNKIPLKSIAVGFGVLVVIVFLCVTYKVEPISLPQPKHKAMSRPIVNVAPKRIEKQFIKTDPKPVISAKRISHSVKEAHPNFVPIGIQKMRKKVHKVRTNNVARATVAPYENTTEQILTHIFMREVGDPPPPITMLNIPERERENLIAILMSKNPITDEDSDDHALAKETIALAKKEMIEYLKTGGTPEEFFTYYYNKLESAYNERKMANVMMMKSLKENPEIVVEFTERINEKLREKGIKELSLPPQFLKNYGKDEK